MTVSSLTPEEIGDGGDVNSRVPPAECEMTQASSSSMIMTSSSIVDRTSVLISISLMSEKGALKSK